MASTRQKKRFVVDPIYLLECLLAFWMYEVMTLRVASDILNLNWIRQREKVLGYILKLQK